MFFGSSKKEKRPWLTDSADQSTYKRNYGNSPEIWFDTVSRQYFRPPYVRENQNQFEWKPVDNSGVHQPHLSGVPLELQTH